jgi:hypothetical protein
MDNMQFYNQLRRPPPKSLKPITSGRLSGKTDINPQWRLEAMTQVFGVCGIGWKYTIDRQWTENGFGNEIMVFVNISLYVKVDGAWSEAIPGSGGHTLIQSEKQGTQFHNNDEAFKMAMTDALSVAMKAIGVGADIYAGLWDGLKYKTEQPQPAKSSSKSDMTIEQARAMKTSDGKLYGELTRAALERIEDNAAAPEEKKRAACLIIAEFIKEGK